MIDNRTRQHELLRQYEVTGLRFLAWLHLVITVLGIIGALSTAQGLLRVLIVGFAAVPSVIFLYVIRNIERVKNLENLGLWVTLFDSILLIFLPFSWYYFQGNTRAPELLVENDLVMFYVLLAVIQSITLRPRQPLLVGTIGVVVMTGCYFWAISDGLPPATDSWLTAINTRQVDINSFWFKSLFMMPFGCGALSLLAWRGRQLVLRSVSLERSITTLSRYFSPAVVDELINDDALSLSLDGKQRDVAILFVDLAGFTSISEKLLPTETVSLLSDYYERMVACVFANHGTVDKFLGDGLMVTFNLLGDQPNAARQAVLTGLAMQSTLEELNAARQLMGRVRLQQRITIHFGPAVVGNVGTIQRMEFTAIGDTVNTASHMQEICKQLQVDFLISDSVYQQFPQAPVQDIGKVGLRGKSDKLQVYAIHSDAYGDINND